MWGISSLAEENFDCQEGLGSIKLVGFLVSYLINQLISHPVITTYMQKNIWECARRLDVQKKLSELWNQKVRCPAHGSHLLVPKYTTQKALLNKQEKIFRAFS